jgi:hypothetical protein
MATTYYKDNGEKLTGSALKKYLKALEKAQKSGKEYTGTKYYTADELSAKYNGYDVATIKKLGGLRSLLLESPSQYTKLSDEQLQATAAAQAETEANLARQNAQALYNSNKTTLENELAGLDSVYQPQISSAQKQTAQNVDSLTGSMLSRGLGRSSYAGALQQATQQAGANTVSGLLNEKGLKQQNIANQISTLGTNYNTAVSTIDQNKASTIQSALDALKQQEYEKELNTTDARSTYLLNLLNQKKKVSSGSSSSSRSSSSSSSGSSSTSTSTGTSSNWLQDMINNLLG